MLVCNHCFTDPEIIGLIKSSSIDVGPCSVCGSEGSLYELDELKDFFTDFLSIFEAVDEGDTIIQKIESDWNLFSSKDVAGAILDEIVGHSDLNISMSKPVKYLDEIESQYSYWQTLKSDLKQNRRYTTRIDDISELKWDVYLQPNYTINSTQEFFRARIHTSDEDEKPFPLKSMGTPPKHLTTAGRANPQGIPYLYLCMDKTTTLYETRVSYLDYVSLAKFKVRENETLNIVDFTQLNGYGVFLQITEFGAIETAKRKLLTALISKDMSKPLRRFDSQIEYVPTQFICEFIRHVSGADGLIFASSLVQEGINLVVFNPNKMECVDVELHHITKVEINHQKI